MKRFAIAFVFFAALLGIWHLLVAYRVWSPVLLPDPKDVGEYLIEAAKSGDLWSALLVTTKRLLLGYFVGVAAGIPIGLLTARFQWAHDTVGVLALGLQTLPSVCWVPLALLWFGQTEAAQGRAKVNVHHLLDGRLVCEQAECLRSCSPSSHWQ